MGKNYSVYLSDSDAQRFEILNQGMSEFVVSALPDSPAKYRVKFTFNRSKQNILARAKLGLASVIVVKKTFVTPLPDCIADFLAIEKEYSDVFMGSGNVNVVFNNSETTIELADWYHEDLATIEDFLEAFKDEAKSWIERAKARRAEKEQNEKERSEREAQAIAEKKEKADNLERQQLERDSQREKLNNAIMPLLTASDPLLTILKSGNDDLFVADKLFFFLTKSLPQETIEDSTEWRQDDELSIEDLDVDTAATLLNAENKIKQALLNTGLQFEFERRAYFQDQGKFYVEFKIRYAGKCCYLAFCAKDNEDNENDE